MNFHLKELRLDSEFMQDQFNTGLVREYAFQINIRALTDRTDALLKTYGL